MVEPTRSRFSYSEMSSLVIESDRSQLVRRDKEGGSGFVESLWGRIDTKEMGIRASRESAPVTKKSRTSASGVPGIKPTHSKRPAQDTEFAGLRYRPKSRETRMAYEFILSLVHSMMSGEQPEDITRGATDEVIAILKSETTGDEQKKQEIAAIVADAPSGKLEQLLHLGIKLTDYQLIQKEEEEELRRHSEDEGGIAVVLQAEDGDEDGEQGLGVVIEYEDDEQPMVLEESQRGEGEPGVLDLASLEFAQGGHTMTNKRCLLPEKSFKKPGKGYEEIHIPAPQPRPMDEGEALVAITSLPEWMRLAFPATTLHLNRVQSRVAPRALESDNNLLVCAPTGAGKTNVALLTMLREIGKHVTESGTVALDQFKLVYIAPMKALVQEQVANFQERLAPFGVTVSELTGDQRLGKAQLADTQVIITTPEKWDVVTRKNNDLSYTRLVKLVIIDEIHLLHDNRGPVLEAIVARTLRWAEETKRSVRILGLSATLPNYGDVARFIRVPSKDDVFFFDGSYRPCPLAQQYIGIQEGKAFKRYQMLNDLTYEKVAEQAGRNQVLVFVHSRKDAAKTARFIRDKAVEQGIAAGFVTVNPDVLRQEAENAKSADLKNLLPFGFGIHHAGMTRADRLLVEGMFRAGQIQVLVATATLAWGVNLPAHRVIIKGTQVYSPERGQWVELSNQDILQMMGRAGRPQFDTEGEGIIITSHTELQYYLSLLNQQLPIESQLVSRLVDNLNAEIVLGTVKNRKDAVEWLGFTYLHIRMQHEPALYGIESSDDDPGLLSKRTALIHSAALILDKANMIRYDRRSGSFQATDIGRIASHYYVSHVSMTVYNEHLRSTLEEIDLFRVFSLSQEFRQLPIRQEERLELTKLLERVPIPVKEGADEPAAKVNALLQAHISQLALEGFAMIADMVYVTQSASRIWRAIYEMCLHFGWAHVARKALNICKMVEHKQWLSMTPLRQIPSGLPMDLVRRVERKDFPWARLRDLNPQELSELFRQPKLANQLHDVIHQFPKVELVAQVLPLSHTLLRIELTVTPDFDWNTNFYGSSLPFIVLVEDIDQEQVLFIDHLLLKSRYARQEHVVSITIPLVESPAIFVSVISEDYLHCETKIAIPMHKMLMPERDQPCTDSVDLHPLPDLDPIQSQVLNALQGDASLFIGGPTITCRIAELAIEKGLANPKAVIVFMAPQPEVIRNLHARWSERFNASVLVGDTTLDLRTLESSQLVLTTPTHFDAISRRWKQRVAVQRVTCIIADNIHTLGTEQGTVMEICLSRLRSMQSSLNLAVRFIALGYSINDAHHVGEWIGASQVFNFPPSLHPVQLHIHPVSISHHASQMIAMTRPTYHLVMARTKSVVFVDTKTQAYETASDFVAIMRLDGRTEQVAETASDPDLAIGLQFGVAYYHPALEQSDKLLIQECFSRGRVQVLVISRESIWDYCPEAELAVIMGTQFYDGHDRRFVDYPLADMVRMLHSAPECHLFCPTRMRPFYTHVLFEPLPLESQLDQCLHDLFNSEIASRIITSKQDAVEYMTWSFMYRRLTANPSYYGMTGRDIAHVSEHLSELVENTITDLASTKCVEVAEDDMTVSPLNLGQISAYYAVKHSTIEMFAASLTATSRIKAILDILAASSEFSTLSIRADEEDELAELHERVPMKLPDTRYFDPHVKANLLLQAHFSRIALSADLDAVLRIILPMALNLLIALVDVVASQAWMASAMAAMRICQMIVQAVWDSDHPLRQIGLPPVENISSIYDFIELPDDDKFVLLEGHDASSVARFCNRYPAPEVSWEIDTTGPYSPGQALKIRVVIQTDYHDDDLAVPSLHYPTRHLESWWILIADANSPILRSIKRITMTAPIAECLLDLEVPVEASSVWNARIFVVCDSFVGADQEHDLVLAIETA